MDMGTKKTKILEGMIIANCQQCIFVRDWKPGSPALLLDGYFACTVTPHPLQEAPALRTAPGPVPNTSAASCEDSP